MGKVGEGAVRGIYYHRTRASYRPVSCNFSFPFTHPVPSTVLSYVKDVGERRRQPPEGAPRQPT